MFRFLGKWPPLPTHTKHLTQNILETTKGMFPLFLSVSSNLTNVSMPQQCQVSPAVDQGRAEHSQHFVCSQRDYILRRTHRLPSGAQGPDIGHNRSVQTGHDHVTQSWEPLAASAAVTYRRPEQNFAPMASVWGCLCLHPGGGAPSRSTRKSSRQGTGRTGPCTLGRRCTDYGTKYCWLFASPASLDSFSLTKCVTTLVSAIITWYICSHSQISLISPLPLEKVLLLFTMQVFTYRLKTKTVDYICPSIAKLVLIWATASSPPLVLLYFISLKRRQRSTPQKHFWVLVSVRIWVNPAAILRLEGLGQLEKIQRPQRVSNPRPSDL
jgi:hypothetical protein